MSLIRDTIGILQQEKLLIGIGVIETVSYIVLFHRYFHYYFIIISSFIVINRFISLQNRQVPTFFCSKTVFRRFFARSFLIDKFNLHVICIYAIFGQFFFLPIARCSSFTNQFTRELHLRKFGYFRFVRNLPLKAIASAHIKISKNWVGFVVFQQSFFGVTLGSTYYLKIIKYSSKKIQSRYAIKYSKKPLYNRKTNEAYQKSYDALQKMRTESIHVNHIYYSDLRKIFVSQLF